MSFEGWIVFAVFWGIFVITPGPNAVAAIGAVFNVWLRGSMAVGFIVYGLILGTASPMGRS